MINVRKFFLQAFLMFLLKRLSTVQSENATALTDEKYEIKLGGLFTIYGRKDKEECNTSDILYESVETSEMVLYAIDQINSNESILPGIKLVLEIKPDCHVDTVALYTVVKIIRESEDPEENTGLHSKRFWGLLGPPRSEVAVPVAKLLGLFKIPQVRAMDVINKTKPQYIRVAFALLVKRKCPLGTNLLRSRAELEQISCGATASVLSDKQRFPSFFRTVPSDVHQIKAIVTLLNRNNWTYVSFIYEDDDYGIAAFDEFQARSVKYNICLAHPFKLSRDTARVNFTNVVRTLAQDNPSRVVIVFLFQNRLVELFEEVRAQNLSDRFQWIGSDAWSGLTYSNSLSDVDGNESSNEAIRSVVDGAIIFQLPTKKVDGFKNYLMTKSIAQSKKNNEFFANLIADSHNCSLKENRSDTCDERLTLSTSIYNHTEEIPFSTPCSSTVYAFATALDKARKDLCGNESICTDFKNMNHSLIVNYLRNISFTDDNGDLSNFTKSQDGPGRYDILQYSGQKDCWRKIGKYANTISFFHEVQPDGKGKVTSVCSKECEEKKYKVYHQDKKCCWHCKECGSNEGLNASYVPSPFSSKNDACFKCDNFSRPVNQTCQPLEEKYLSFHNPLAWAVVAASIMGILLTVFTGGVYISNWSTPLIRASGRELSTLILLGIFLAFAISFLFCVRPTDFICGLRRFTIGFCFALMFSGLLVKTIRISIVFNHLGKHMVQDYKLILRPGPQVITALLLTCIEVFVLIVWMLQEKPEMIKMYSPVHINQKDRYNIIDCKELGSHSILIGITYPIVLILTCTFFAIKIRKVPVGFNEAKFIGFTVYTTLVIWLAQLSTYLVQTDSEIILRDAIYCLCLSLNALVILLGLFGPKVYIVLLRPEKNNQSLVMATSRHPSTATLSTIATPHPTRENSNKSKDPKKRSPKFQFNKKLKQNNADHSNVDVTRTFTLPQIGTNGEEDLTVQSSIKLVSKNSCRCEENNNEDSRTNERETSFDGSVNLSYQSS